MRITFHGGAGEVTGSKHLVEIGKYRVLLDCGMFQGHRREAYALNRLLPFDARTIDAVVLSHGHLDHCGMMPVLTKHGYQGKIYATAATRDVAEWILLDSAHINEQDAQYMNKHRLEGAELAQPPYTPEDVLKTMEQFVAVPYVRESHDWFEILPKVKIKLYDAGHILGSAVIVLQGEEDGKIFQLAYSGDLGRPNTPLIRDPEYITDQVDTLLLESTYGKRLHHPVQEAASRLAELVNQVYARGGKIIVPSFALGRTQELVYLLHELTDQGKIPRIQTYVDSPLANKLTEIFKRYPENYDKESWDEFGSKGELPLYYRNLKYVQTVEESKALNTKPGPFMVIASSGTCEGGRIQHHLINGLNDSNNLVLITGYQPQHTLGRRLVEGERVVKIFGQRHGVRAQVAVLNELSAHADAVGLQDYAEHVPGLRSIYLVHGEHTQAQALGQRLVQQHPGWGVRIPARDDKVELNQ